MSCFLDLDGCLADLVTASLAFHGRSLPPAEVRWGFPKQVGFASGDDPAFWSVLPEGLWATLPWTHEGRDIVAAAEAVFGDDVAILTAPTKYRGCAEGKLEWVRRNLPQYEDRVILCKHKSRVAGPGKVLVDDHDLNIDLWVKKGGVGVWVPRPWNVCSWDTCSLGRFDVARWSQSLARAKELAGGVR